jgi:hypothetical protein
MNADDLYNALVKEMRRAIIQQEKTLGSNHSIPYLLWTFSQDNICGPARKLIKTALKTFLDTHSINHKTHP